MYRFKVQIQPTIGSRINSSPKCFLICLLIQQLNHFLRLFFVVVLMFCFLNHSHIWRCVNHNYVLAVRQC
jgi:hypothetical protein